MASYLAYTSTLKKEAKLSCETSADFQRNIWRFIPEDRILQHSKGLSPSVLSLTIIIIIIIIVFFFLLVLISAIHFSP
jgi:hypothetical protein